MSRWVGVTSASVARALGYTPANGAALGVAAGTSLALGGATIGSHALAVTGTALFNDGITSTIGTITVSEPMMAGTQTWNDGAVAFKGLSLNVTNTASASGSRLLDLLVASSSVFSVKVDGTANMSATKTTEISLYAGLNETGNRNFFANSSTPRVVAGGAYGWSSSTTDAAQGSLDTSVSRNAAGVVESNGSFRTAAPASGTAANWKFGVRVAATVALDTTQYIQLDVGGTLYKVGVVTE